MKIAIVALNQMDTKVDGITNYFRHFSNYINKSKDLELQFVTASTQKKPKKQNKKITINYVPLLSSQEFYEGIRFSLSPITNIVLYTKLVKLFKKEKYDIIQITSSDTFCGAALLAAKRLGIPVVGNYHTCIPEYVEHWFKVRKERLFIKLVTPLGNAITRFGDKLIYGSCNHLMAPTPTIKEKLQNKKYHKKIIVLGRGVDQELFSPKKTTSTKKNNKQKCTALYIGRLSPEKNLESLRFLKNQKNIQLVIVGDGPYRKVLEKKLPFAKFTGFLRGKKLAQEYAKADIFLFPSKTDTFSNVVLEALASGLPVIGYQNANLDDRVHTNKNGFLVPTKESFEKKTLQLAKNQKLRKELSTTARKSSLRFNWKSIFDNHIKLYRKVVGRG